MKDDFFVNGEVNMSVVGVVMKFSTESRNFLTEWHSIKEKKRESRKYPRMDLYGTAVLQKTTDDDLL